MANRFISTPRVVLIYGVFAAIWILLSDWLLELFVSDRATLVLLSTAKGWLFVAVTSALLYGLVSRLVAQVQTRSIEREQALRENQRKFVTFIEEAPAALAMFDRQMCYLAASTRWKKDYRLADRDIIGYNHYELLPDMPPQWKEAYRKAMAGEVVGAEEDCYRRSDGGLQWIRWEVQPWQANAGVVGGIIAFSEDITSRKLAESELQIAAVAFACQQAVFITDRHSVILRVNPAFENVTGYSAEEIVGKTPQVLQSGRHGKDFYDALWSSLISNNSWHGEIWNRRKNGEVYPEDLTISAVLDSTGSVTNYVATFTDISRNKHAEETIHSLSFYDVLTGLPNHRLTLERLQQDMASHHRATHYGAILIVNLDRFSLLNDARNRQVGDAALMEAASRIVGCVSINDTVGRFGADEFAVLVGELGTERNRAAVRTRDIAGRLLSSIKASMLLDGIEHVCTACIGIRIYRGGSGICEDLMRQAHAALFQAKKLGPDHIRFFDIDMQSALENHVLLESLLRQAMPKQFRLYFQPQVDQTGKVSGVEALIRWWHPQKGMILPGEFIPLAEETGMILPIGKWVLETACRQLKAWEIDMETRSLSMAVNVSAKQLTQSGFVEEVLGVIQRTGADPHKLELELTESTLFEDAEAVTEKMSALKAKGIRFSLDDFGTGFSSLTYLRRMPLDKLKIDQSFISHVDSNPNDAAIARTIIALGQSLGLSVIAEGVETEEQRSFLAVHGCTSYQGFLFGKPVAVADLEHKIRLERTTLH